jgi:hypothetical protein
MAEQSLLEQAQAAAKAKEYDRALQLYDQVGRSLPSPSSPVHMRPIAETSSRRSPCT